MTINISNSSEGQKIVIDDELTIFKVAEYQQTLLEYPDFKKSVSLDLSAVEEVDTAGLQLLLSLLKHLDDLDCEIAEVSTNAVVDQGLELFNLHNFFQQPILDNL